MKAIVILVIALVGYTKCSESKTVQTMLDKKQARLIALAYIKELEKQKPARPLAIIDDKIIEKPYAWVFPITTEAYLKTGDIREEEPGLGPVIVDRKKHTAHSAPSSINIEIYLRYYESKLTNKE